MTWCTLFLDRVGAELGWQRLLMHMTFLQGVFNLSVTCRSGAKEGIEELKLFGVRTAMLTGDCLAAAVLVQDQDLKNKGTVAMIGDGMNDAQALATADIGISMGISGSALATETGHMILMLNDIRKIPEAVRLERRARKKLMEKVILLITVKGAILVLALAGFPLIRAAVVANVLWSLSSSSKSVSGDNVVLFAAVAGLAGLCSLASVPFCSVSSVSLISGCNIIQLQQYFYL
ncbi:hypothetical protein RHSIM_Rhsim02G0072300 [Rhododendron simsii]|uniref:Uncharacterized protein n=1 Tax=Rhododendron simsii TaxID=118357 RepID=A0A834HBY5_RHOSS|nr:hypothetical protein RHSIM_Rhsim02G0072300 [Rhododendron simsii]